MSLKYEVAVSRYYCVSWNRHGQWHRIGGPAVYNSLGEYSYYEYGERHRTDGLALEYQDMRQYFRRGRRIWLLNIKY